VSLINQVLKDLDKRNSSAETGKLLSGEVRNPPLPKRSSKSLISIIVLLGLAGGGYFVWGKYLQPVTPPVTIAQAPPAPIKQPAPPPAAPIPPVVETAAPPAAVAGTDTTPQAGSAVSLSPSAEAGLSPNQAIAGTTPASSEPSISASAAGVLLSLDFPASAKYKVFTLGAPNRVVVDLEGIGLTPELERLPAKLTTADSDIADIRVGRFTPTVTRIVLGLKGALPDVKSSTQPAASGGQRLLVQWGQPAAMLAQTTAPPPQHFLGMEKELKPQLPSTSAKSDDSAAAEKREERKTSAAHLRPSRSLLAKTGPDTEAAAFGATGKPRHEKPTAGAVRGGPAEALKVMSAQQRSDNFYRQSVAMLQQGRVVEAKEILRQALGENPVNHAARQLLVGLLVEESQQSEAMKLLRDGLRLAPEQTAFSMALARLQIEASDRQGGLATLQEGLQYAGDDAEYHAFMAALLQREDRHEEAVEHYVAALKSNPAMPSWLVGIGISLQAQGKLADASEAFNRAKRSGGLTPDLAQFVDQRIGQIKQQLH